MYLLVVFAGSISIYLSYLFVYLFIYLFIYLGLTSVTNPRVIIMIFMAQEAWSFMGG